MHANYCSVLRWDFANFQMHQTAVRINNASSDQKSFLVLHQEKHLICPIPFPKLFDSQKCTNNLRIIKKKIKNAPWLHLGKKENVAGCLHGYLFWNAGIRDDSGVDLICP